MLQAGVSAASLAKCRHGCRLETYGGEHRRQVTLYQRPVLPVRAVTGTYKVLLVPFRDGEKPPQTTWDRAQLSVRWPDQQDTFTFQPRPDGRTTLRVHRLAATGDQELGIDEPPIIAPAEMTSVTAEETRRSQGTRA